MYKKRDRIWSRHIDYIIQDVLAVELALMISCYIRFGYFWPYNTALYGPYGFIIALVDIATVTFLNTMHDVERRGFYKEFLASIKQVFVVSAVMMSYMFTAKNGHEYSRLVLYWTILFHLVIGYITRILWRLIKRTFRKHNKQQSLILVSTKKLVPHILKNFEKDNKYSITGLVITDKDLAGQEICGVKVVSNLADAPDYFCREWVDEVFIYPSSLTNVEIEFGDKVTVASLISDCIQMSIPVHFRIPVLNLSDRSFMDKIAGYNVLTIVTNNAGPVQLFFKRLLDIFGGLVGSLLAIIILLIVGPIIKVQSPGPVIFKQTRIGRNGKKFKMFKIRSMYMDAEERKKDLLKDNRIQNGMMFKLEWDPRVIGNKIVNGKKVTGIGEFIRKYSLDEFPQFFNVLRGQMSLVGTRPPTVDEWEKYKYHHRARLATRPGITGMWQVSGRSQITDFEQVVRLDTEYIQKWNLGLDIKILLKTVISVIKGKGAM